MRGEKVTLPRLGGDVGGRPVAGSELGCVGGVGAVDNDAEGPEEGR